MIVAIFSNLIPIANRKSVNRQSAIVNP